MPKTFRSAVLAVQAQGRMRNRFMNKVEDPNNPYSNHSETESDSEDEVIPEEKPQVPPPSIVGSTVTIVESEEAKVAGRSKWRRYRGMLLALLSCFLASLASLLVKKLKGYNYDPFYIAIWRFQGVFLPAISVILHTRYFSEVGTKIADGIWPWTKLANMGMFGLVLVRSILSCNAVLLQLHSLKYLSLGDASTITNSSPIFVALLAKVFLKEKCGLVTVIASLLTLAGVIAMTRPPMLTGASFDQNTLIGSGLAFGCMLLASVSYTLLRYFRNVHYSITMIVFGLWGSVENIILAMVFDVLKMPVEIQEWGLLLGIALFTFLEQCTIILAMAAEQASAVALIGTFGAIFSFMWDMIFLHNMPDLISIIGTMVIIFSVLICGFRKWLRGLPVGHPTRARYRYFMM